MNKEIKQKAFEYYCKGLNSKEIAKLLDVSFRTVQNWSSADKWKQTLTPTPLIEKAQAMHKRGFSYSYIAKQLNVSNSTIYNWLKRAKKKPF